MLKNINQFSLDRKKDPEVLNRILINYIDNFVEDKRFTNLINWLSNEIQISPKSLSCDCKLFIFNQFENINYLIALNIIILTKIKIVIQI